MSTPSLKERQHQVREEAILDAAQALLIEVGYDGLTMDDLAHRVGIAKATLYQHFPSKADVMVGVVTRMMKRGEEMLFSATSSGLPPLEQLRIGLQRALTERMKIRSWRVNSTADVVKKNERFQVHHDRLVQQMIALLAAAQADGSIAPEVCLPVAATAISWLFRIDYDSFLRAGEVTADQVIDTLVMMVIDGLRTCSFTEKSAGEALQTDNSPING